ncbi:MAG: VCBS repeat-containing protein, partial [Dehalococcoidia bacterium]|nr:VCBS repeat-containing protein [Dehalococcoidia bacterium]
MNMQILLKHLFSVRTRGTRFLLLGLGLLAVSLAVLLPVAVSSAQTVSFGTATNFASGTEPLSVAIGDLNGDGKPDLATANASGGVSVLLGTGTGSFAAATSFAVALPPYADPALHSIAISDLNGDSKPDLVALHYGLPHVSVLLGTGTGAFGAATNFAGARDQYGMAIGDLNGDGKP